MIPLAPATAGLALGVLWRAGFGPRWVIITLALLPFIVFAAPAKGELVATILIEAPVVYTLGLTMRIDGLRLMIASGFVNALTQPLLNVALRCFGSADHWCASFLLLEVMVWVTEALLYVAFIPGLRQASEGTSKAFIVSLAANATSAVIGLAIAI